MIMNMKTDLAIIYSNKSIECERAIALMQSIDQPFIEYLIDREFTQTQFEKEFGADAEYPQIAIGVKHIGSLKDTLQYFNYNGVL